MTATLLGQDASTWSGTTTGLAQTASGNAMSSGGLLQYNGVPGVADTAWINIGQSGGTATFIKLCAYDANGNLAMVSAPIPAHAAGIQSAAIAGIITAQKYGLVAVPDQGYFAILYLSGSSAFVSKQWVAGDFSYAAPPASIPPVDLNLGFLAAMWITGTPTGGGQRPPTRRRRVQYDVYNHRYS